MAQGGKRCSDGGYVLQVPISKRPVVPIPVKVTFRNVDQSDAVEQDIRKHAEKLAEFDNRILWCNVGVESDGKHRRKGRVYRISVNVGRPGKTIVTNRAGPHNPAHADIYVAIRDAFAATTRQVEDHVRISRDDVKTHETPQHGRVIRIFEEEGYGFILTSEGEEVYFHRNSVPNGNFGKLDVGSEVRLEIAYDESEKGYQATVVKPVGKHHIA